MFDELHRYPGYRQADIPWISQIPTHWDAPLNQRIFRETTRPYAGTPETQLSLSQRQGLVPTRQMEERSLQTSSFDKWKVVLPGDLVVNRFKAHLGVFFAATERGITTFHYGVFQPRIELNTRYFELLFHTPQYCTIYAGRSNGMTVGLQNLSNQNFYNVHTLLPPPDEQAAIVRFLDHADRRIRRYIRAKQKLIKLLEEQKQAIIHQAVTRGLDPSVPMKDSGLPWIPVMPAHWRILRLKVIAARIVDCLHATPNYVDNGEFPAIRTADIVPGDVRWQSARRIAGDEYSRWTERLDPQEGDILYSREGERYGIAACVPPGVRLCISQRMMAFRIRPEHDSQFVMWALNDPQTYAQASQDVMGATAPHVNISTIRNYGIATPPQHEQVQIAEYVAASTGGFSAALAAAQREISLLRELRTRLIADVVTGQLDVRAAAAALPDDPTDDEPLDDADEPGDDDLDTDAAPEDDDA